MAEPVFTFDESSAEKIGRAVDWYQSQFRDRRKDQPQDDSPPQQWVPCKNTESTTIPANSLVEVTAITVAQGQYYVSVRKPSLTALSPIGVTWGKPIGTLSEGGTGAITFDPVALVAYDTGSPAVGEVWGLKPAQYTAARYFPGFVVLGVVDATRKIILSQRQLITTLIGKTTGTATAGASTTSYKIYTGAAGSEADGGWTTVPSAYNRSATDIASGKWIGLSFVNGVWYMTPLEC